MLLNQLNKISDCSINKTSQVVSGNVSALGSSNTRYTVTLKSGTKINNITGPSDLTVGDAVLVSASQGRNKQYVVLGKSGGASELNINRVKV
jgi:hypothetical protein